jgi:hypothetical protein
MSAEEPAKSTESTPQPTPTTAEHPAPPQALVTTSRDPGESPISPNLPEPRNLVKEWTSRLMSIPFIAAIILITGLIGGIASLLKSSSDISQSFEKMHPNAQALQPSTQPGADQTAASTVAPAAHKQITETGLKPQLVAFTLSPSSVGYVQTQDWMYAVGPATYKTFALTPPPNKDPQAIFLVTIKNPLDRDIIISEIDYDVISVGEVRGIESGPLQSLATYRQTIAHEVGLQKRDLVPPFQIAALSAASFELHLLSESRGFGLGWYLRVIFKTDEGNVTTDPFQLYLPSLSPTDAVPPRSIASSNKPQKTKDLLSIPKEASPNVPIETEKCFFGLAHLKNELSGMDQLDLDFLYSYAAHDTADEFATRYPKIPAAKRERLQTVIKTSIGCSAR